ncbi:YrdB family protein [Haloglycomyces albus]|uniref:YrdB family protein n=1 Tax=Haloglycomyces albus TaxID=526067 RepID=UPI003CCBD295
MLVVRFVLEIVAFIGYFIAGWQLWGGALSVASAAILAGGVVLVWGTFNVPGDPTRSGSAPVAVRGMTRLYLEVGILGGAVFAYLLSGWVFVGLLYGVFLAGYFYIARDRFDWLQKVDETGRTTDEG